MCKISDSENATTIFNQEGVVGKQLLKQEKNEYIYLNFKANCQTQLHVQEILMTFYIVKGQAKVIVDQTIYELNKGQIIEIPAGKSRQWINTGNESLELFVIKTTG